MAVLVRLVELQVSPFDNHTPEVLVRVDEEVRSRRGSVTGTLADLLHSYWKGQTPIGIVLDRWQEDTERPDTEMGELVGLSPAVKLAGLQWMRNRHPAGV